MCTCVGKRQKERDREKERAREYIEYHFSCFSITLPLAIWGDTANNKWLGVMVRGRDDRLGFF